MINYENCPSYSPTRISEEKNQYFCKPIWVAKKMTCNKWGMEEVIDLINIVHLAWDKILPFQRDILPSIRVEEFGKQ